MSKEVRERDAQLSMADSSRDGILKLVVKLKEKGSDALTDDEYQVLKHAAILADNSDELCDEADFDIEDRHCLDCRDIDACIAREIKRYL